MSGAQITLITGQPGSGKTAKTVDMLRDEVSKGRVVFVLGIPGLTLPHVPMPPVSEWTVSEPIPEDPTIVQAHLAFPDGCLIVIDECQKIYRPRSAASAVPPYVAALETHRHKGIDIWLLTQHYTFLDSNVRKLVKRHIHCRDHWTGWRTYERGEAFDHESPSERKVASVRPYKPNKAVFGLYTSSSKHVKRVRQIPRWVYAVPVVLGAIAFYSFDAYNAVYGQFRPGNVQETSVGGATSGAAALPLDTGASVRNRPTVPTPDQFIPRITTRPETAPLYDQVRQVRHLPTIAGCASIAARCKCYTSQGTDAFLTPEQCREWIANPPFDPFSQKSERQVASPSTEKRSI